MFLLLPSRGSDGMRGEAALLLEGFSQIKKHGKYGSV